MTATKPIAGYVNIVSIYVAEYNVAPTAAKRPQWPELAHGLFWSRRFARLFWWWTAFAPNLVKRLLAGPAAGHKHGYVVQMSLPADLMMNHLGWCFSALLANRVIRKILAALTRVQAAGLLCERERHIQFRRPEQHAFFHCAQKHVLKSSWTSRISKCKQFIDHELNVSKQPPPGWDFRAHVSAAPLKR